MEEKQRPWAAGWWGVHALAVCPCVRRLAAMGLQWWEGEMTVPQHQPSPWPSCLAGRVRD